MTVDEAVLIDYALGTLPEDQVEEVERFLHSHPGAAGEVRRAQDAMAELVMSLPAETASQAAEEALIERLRRHREPPRKRRQRAAGARRSPRWAALGLAAALGVAAWLALGPFRSSERADPLIARYQGQPGALSRSLTTEEGDELGTMVRLRDGSLFVAFDQQPSSGVYQLWEIRDEGIESLAVVDDHTVLTEPLSPGSVFGVTVEPPGGSPQPTSEPIILVPL